MVVTGLARAIISRSRTPRELANTVGSTKFPATAAGAAQVKPTSTAAVDVSD